MTDTTEQGDSAQVCAIFEAISAAIGSADMAGLLDNWNESELCADTGAIVRWPGRDGRRTRGEEGGAVTIGKDEFLKWLQSEAPFSTKVYGEGIGKKAEWVTLILRARNAAQAANLARNGEATPLAKGKRVRIRAEGSSDEWTEATVLVLSENGKACGLGLEGMLRTPGGALISGNHPLVIDTWAKTVKGLFGESYEMEVMEK